MCLFFMFTRPINRAHTQCAAAALQGARPAASGGSVLRERVLQTVLQKGRAVLDHLTPRVSNRLQESK